MQGAQSEYTILQRLPTAQQYYKLREAVKLTPPPADSQDAEKGLANSVVCFLAFERASMHDERTPAHGQEPIGMARIVGDGALFLQLTDVAVHPAHQRKGLATRILKTVVDYVDEHAPNAYLSLIGDPPGQRLYAQFGFDDVAPTGSMGMFRCRRMQGSKG